MEQEIKKQVGTFSRGTVPPDCLILVAGAEYHKSKARGIVRIDYEVRGFGYGMKNWVITTGSVNGWDTLDSEVLLSPFPRRVMVMFVDSGYEPDEVYKYCLKRPGLTIPTKGTFGPQRAPLVVSKLGNMQLIIVNTSFFKDKVTMWMQPQVNEDGEVIAEPLTEFYAEIPDYYFKEFSNEHKAGPTHSLDVAVLCAAAAFHKGWPDKYKVS